jgi:hypothetical protein
MHRHREIATDRNRNTEKSVNAVLVTVTVHISQESVEDQ